MRLLDPPPCPAHLAPPPPPPSAPALGTGSRLWLVRHAEVAEAWRDVAYGSNDVPLSARGLEQTAALGARFAAVAPRHVYSSDLPRARAMADAIAQASGGRVTELPALREIDRGNWSGRPLAEFDADWRADVENYWRDPWRWKAHGGESDADLFARAWPAVERAAREAAGDTAVLATHGNWIRIVLGRVLGVSVFESFDYRVRVATASAIVDGEEGWRLEVFGTESP